MLLYITYLVLIYLITENLYLLTAFIQFPLASSLVSGNHIPDCLFFYEFVCFWSIIDLQHHVSSCYTIQWVFFSIHLKMISKSCDTTPYKDFNYWLYSPHCTFHTHNLFCNWKYLLISLMYFSPPNTPLLWQPLVCSLCFVRFIHLKKNPHINEIMQYLSFSVLIHLA